jgi:hypothetical protein
MLCLPSQILRRTVRVDGGRLKLECGELRGRAGRQVEDVLFWDGDQLLGFLGLYAFGSPAAELAGMVDPRRDGAVSAPLSLMWHCGCVVRGGMKRHCW